MDKQLNRTKQLLNPFFGQNMNMVFWWLDKQGIKYEQLIPSQFSDLMDKITGLKGTGIMEPEEAANKWLLEIADMERKGK